MHITNLEVRKTKSVEWWRSAAQHMWRTYFALLRDGFTIEELSDTNRKIFIMCNQIYSTRFIRTDQDILKMYFTSRWGDDLYAVDEYSTKHNIPQKVIWMVIRRANRAVMEETGLLEKKGENDDE